jgi:tRNA-splicing ligase RtcB
VAEHASEFEWRAEGEEAEVAAYAPDARTADRALRRALPAAGLPGAESPLYAVAGPAGSFGLVAASGTHVAPGLVGAPERGLLLAACNTVPNLRVPPEDVPRGIPRRLAEVTPPSVGDAELRAIAEGGALWAAEAGLIEEEDLPYLEPPPGTAPGDADSLGRRALLAGARDWSRPGSIDAYRVADLFDADGAGSLGLEPGVIVLVVRAGAEDLGRLALGTHQGRISSRVAAGADFGASRDLPAAPLDSEEAHDLTGASAASANFAAARAALLLYALRRALRDVLGALEPRAGWTLGGLQSADGLLLHRDGLAVAAEGAPLVSGGEVVAGTGAMLGSAPPFGVPPTENGRWPWEEAGLIDRWALLGPLTDRVAG